MSRKVISILSDLVLYLGYVKHFVPDHRGSKRCLPYLVEPGEVGLLAMQTAGDRVHQDRRSRPSLEAAGPFARQHALRPAMTGAAGGAQGALAPGDAKTPGPFGAMVGRLNAVLDEQDPERVPLLPQEPDQAASLVVPIMILVHPRAPPRVPGPSRSPWRGHGRQRAQPPQCRERPRPPGCQGRGATLRAVQMRGARQVCRPCPSVERCPRHR